MLGEMAEVCQIIFNLNGKFLLSSQLANCMVPISQATRRRQPSARDMRGDTSVQDGFANGELASSPCNRFTR